VWKIRTGGDACHLANISLRSGRKLRWDAEGEQIVDDNAGGARCWCVLPAAVGRCSKESGFLNWFSNMNRRDFLLASSAAVASRALAASPPVQKSNFGVCIYSYGGTRKFADTWPFSGHCNSMGAAGIQMQLTSLDLPFAEKVKAKAAEYGMYYEGIVTLPKPGGEDDFEKQLESAKRLGARLVRSACLVRGAMKRSRTWRHGSSL